MCIIQNNRGVSPVNFAEDDKPVTKTLDIVTARVVEYMIAKSITLSTAESCTGGMVSEMVTSVAGASGIFKGGVCSYTEEMKMKLLGVSPETLKLYTVYSAQVASEMSLGVMKLTDSDAAIGVTGIAGPGGGSDEKPVGTVYVSVRYKDLEVVCDLMLYKEYEDMDRNFIRKITTQKALEMLWELLHDRKAEDR